MLRAKNIIVELSHCATRRDDVADVKWTDAQRRAIEDRGNILVSAAAGSGKTATLSARILHLLKTDPNVTLGDFLIVTFTNAAAADLRTRIGRETAQLVREDKELSGRVGSASSADICTMHSFCLKLIRENFTSLGLPPDVRIGDEAETEMRAVRAMEETIDDFFADDAGSKPNGGCSISELADTLGRAKDSSGLDQSLGEIYKRLRAIGEDAGYLVREADEIDSCASMDFLDTAWGGVLRGKILSEARHELRVISTLSTEMSDSKAVTEKYMPAATALIEYLERIVRCCERGDGYESLKNALETCETVSLGRLSAKDKTEEAARFQSARLATQKKLAALCNKYFNADAKDISDSMRRTASVLRTAAAVIAEFDRRYTLAKRERGILDFSDLELLALKLLENPDGTPSDAARSAGAGYKFIFIDEYQDTNSVQDRIFRALGEGSERFFVGDIKQSIYRFRGAQPEVFSGYRRAWPEDGSGSCDGYPSGHCVFMSENFRCAEPIVDFVNAVSRYMFPYGGIPFGEEDCLRYGGVSEGECPVELCILERPARRASDEAEGVEEPMSEARYAARRVLSLIRDEGVHPSDIAILLRSANTDGAEYEKELLALGIPVRRVGGSDFSESPEVILALDLLRAIDNPMRDIPLAGAMLSSVFGFSLDELVELRCRRRDVSLYESAASCAEEDCDELARHCEDFVSRLSALRYAERGMSAERFIEYMYGECGFFDLPEVLRSPMAPARLHLIHDTARSFEGGESADISTFLAFVDEKLSSGGLNAEGTSDGDGVSVMSIHKSKGLEYRVCFLCGCGKGKNRSDENGRLLFDSSLGFAMYLPDPSGLVLCGNPLRSAVGIKISESASEEEMRVLYVALTRARERLIITAKSELSAAGELERARETVRFVDKCSALAAPRLLDHILGGIVTDPACRCNVFNIGSDGIPEGEHCVSDSDDGADEQEISEADVALLRRTLEFEYPREFLKGIPKKLSVSELSDTVLDDGGKSDDRQNERVLPRFMSGATDQLAASKGTSTHVFLQFADFDRLRREGAESERDRLVKLGFITKEMADLVALPQIDAFASGEVMDRILSAAEVYREFRFNVALPASGFTANDELRGALEASGTMLTVQGVFDCLFREVDGRLVLLDYKTDALTERERETEALGEDTLRRRHAPQLGYYAMAAECLFGKRPDEIYIYSLTLGRAVPLL